jgi:hypothetical protein
MNGETYGGFQGSREDISQIPMRSVRHEGDYKDYCLPGCDAVQTV